MVHVYKRKKGRNTRRIGHPKVTFNDGTGWIQRLHTTDGSFYLDLAK